ncbi:MAG: potassium/proton antiporter [Caulobacterales bacterium]|nr:potassium/proton antiporter [Caulobacterales bacterium]
MDPGAQLLLTISGLVLAALFAAAAGERVGAPLLLVFLAVGLLAGPEGPGGVELGAPDLAFTLTSAALAVILLDGALRTRPETLSAGWRPGLLLATAGTAATAVVTGLAAMLALDASWREGLLIGAIVSSTDAAAVFSLIGGKGARTPPRLAATLETESGLNDPIAVFLTLALAGSLANADASEGPLSLALSLSWQIVGGGVIGVLAGLALAALKPRLSIAAGLKPLLTLSGGLFAFAAAQAVGASGFLAVYLAGLLQARAARGVVEAEARALDGFAWLAQLSLFLVLGLMASPAHLISVAAPAVAIAIALMFLARPVVVMFALRPFGFDWRERAFASWTGLRGATPIFLGLAPAALGVPNASLYFSVAFVVVCLSLVAQGWTIPVAARVLGLTATREDEEEGRSARLSRPGPARLAAAGLGLAAIWTMAVWLARDVAPPEEPAWRPETVAELAAWSENGRRPPDALPADWPPADEAERRRLFTALVAELARRENAAVLADRALVRRWMAEEAAGESQSLREQARRGVLANRYGGDYADLEGLLARVDVAPPSLAVAQAALTTGWGASRAAGEDRELFGRPGARESLAASVRGYVRTLNTHPDFAAFRAERARLRAAGAPLSGGALAPHVGAFAASGEAFARNVAAIIATAGLAALDAAEAGE